MVNILLKMCFKDLKMYKAGFKYVRRSPSIPFDLWMI